MVNGTHKLDQNDQSAIDRIVFICSPGPSCQLLLDRAVVHLEPRSVVEYYSKDDTDVAFESNVMAIGRITFPTTAAAERVFALLNGITLAKALELTGAAPSSPAPCHDEIIQLRYNRFSVGTRHDPLYVQPIAPEHALADVYDYFRASGMILLCQRLDLCPSTVVLQFLSKQDANDAQKQHHQTVLWDHVVTVTTGTWPGVKVPSPIREQRKKSVSSIETLTPTLAPTTVPARRRSHQLQVEIKPSMDLCNLYIKGLSLSMTSTELFNMFKPYGRIISARVMENTQGLSKGFGFVSYSQPLEAASALVSLYGYYSIQFHEPKVTRPDHDTQQQFWCLLQSPLAAYFYSNTLLPLPVPSLSSSPNAYMSPPPSTTPAGAALHHHHHHAPPPPPHASAYPPYYVYGSPFASTSAYASSAPSSYYYPHLPPYYPPTAATATYVSNPPVDYDYSHASGDAARYQMQQALQQVLVNEIELQLTIDALMALDDHDRQRCIEDPLFLKHQLDTLKSNAPSSDASDKDDA
ncbi:hypothetical protein BC940DRAFT_365713 [Gongronella butleri]|nr:hypothetical protein BC940DRAFT_365713 [Gongronella butleri]